MKTATLTILLAVFVPIGSVVAEVPVKAAGIFASAPSVLKPAQLDELEFRVRFSAVHILWEEKIRQRLKDSPDDVELKKEQEGWKQRRTKLEKSPIALYMPKAVFRIDEPVHAYFAIKNKTAKPLGLDMRLDLQLGHATTNACGVSIELLSNLDAERTKSFRQHTWECGGPPRVTLPPNGYYCTRADLRRIGAKAPGTYSIRWNYSGLESQSVEFTIAQAEHDEKIEKPVQAVRLCRIVQAGSTDVAEQAEKVVDPLPPPVIRPARLLPLSYTSFAAELSVGADGNIYPDILDLPSEDQFVAASLNFEEPNGGKVPSTLIVTLTPRQANQGLFLEEEAHFVLMAVTRAEVYASSEFGNVARQDRAQRLRASGHSLADPQRPLRIRIELQEDWPRRVGLAGPVELQVIFSSEPIKLQGRWPGIQRLNREVTEIGINTTSWQGLLCTPAVHIDLPPIAVDGDESAIDPAN